MIAAGVIGVGPVLAADQRIGGNGKHGVTGIGRVCIGKRPIDAYQAVFRRRARYRPTESAVIRCGSGDCCPCTAVVNGIINFEIVVNPGIGPGDLPHGTGIPGLLAVRDQHFDMGRQNNGKHPVTGIGRVTIILTYPAVITFQPVS